MNSRAKETGEEREEMHGETGWAKSARRVETRSPSYDAIHELDGREFVPEVPDPLLEAAPTCAYMYITM